MALNGEIAMGGQADAAEVAAVADLFKEAGFSGPVRAEIEHRSLGEIPFVIYVSVPVTAFLSAFVGAAGKDAYDSRSVGRILSRRVSVSTRRRSKP